MGPKQGKALPGVGAVLLPHSGLAGKPSRWACFPSVQTPTLSWSLTIRHLPGSPNVRRGTSVALLAGSAGRDQPRLDCIARRHTQLDTALARGNAPGPCATASSARRRIGAGDNGTLRLAGCAASPRQQAGVVAALHRCTYPTRVALHLVASAMDCMQRLQRCNDQQLREGTAGPSQRMPDRDLPRLDCLAPRHTERSSGRGVVRPSAAIGRDRPGFRAEHRWRSFSEVRSGGTAAGAGPGSRSCRVNERRTSLHWRRGVKICPGRPVRSGQVVRGQMGRLLHPTSHRPDSKRPPNAAIPPGEGLLLSATAGLAAATLPDSQCESEPAWGSVSSPGAICTAGWAPAQRGGAPLAGRGRPARRSRAVHHICLPGRSPRCLWARGEPSPSTRCRRPDRAGFRRRAEKVWMPRQIRASCLVSGVTGPRSASRRSPRRAPLGLRARVATEQDSLSAPPTR
jgi:hypothetical protein